MNCRLSRELLLCKHGLSPRSTAEHDLIDELYNDPNARDKMSSGPRAHWAARRAEHIMTRAGRPREGEVALLTTAFASKLTRASRSSNGREVVSQEGTAAEGQGAGAAAVVVAEAQIARACAIPGLTARAAASRGRRVGRLRSRSRGLRPDETPAAAGGADSAPDRTAGRVTGPEHRCNSPALASPSRAKSWQQRYAAAPRCCRRAVAQPRECQRPYGTLRAPVPASRLTGGLPVLRARNSRRQKENLMKRHGTA
eukprot:scaffold7816_cov113-Isochrysis_galbana.AAC.2